MATPETEERLLAVGRAGTAHHVERIVRGWWRVDRQAEAGREKEPHADPPTMVPQQADALALLAETALHHLADPDEPGQSVLEDGARVPAGTSQRLACDASRVVMRHGQDGGSWRSMLAPGRSPRRCGAR